MIRYCKIKKKIIGFDRPKICVPLVGGSDDEILGKADAICMAAERDTIDMVEFRGDYYEALNDENKLKNLMNKLQDKFSDMIFLFTIRSEQEGGEKLNFDTPSINEINSFVIKNELADMVDVELMSGVEAVSEQVELAKEHGVKIIMSNHDFNTTPDADVIVNRLRSMQDLGADIAKIAVMPECKMHVLNLLAATAMMSDKYAEVPIVTISMGKLGAISRICGEAFGSAITFSVLDKASAPGQIPVHDLNEIMDGIGKYCV